MDQVARSAKPAPRIASRVGVRAGSTILLASELQVPFLGDALRRAAHGVVTAVQRSGESYGLQERWHEMGIPESLVEGAAVTTASLRRLRGISSAKAATDFLVVEVLDPGRRLLTGSLADEAKELVETGIVAKDAARFHVPAYR